jgi:hypothetical protein
MKYIFSLLVLNAFLFSSNTCIAQSGKLKSGKSDFVSMDITEQTINIKE